MGGNSLQCSHVGGRDLILNSASILICTPSFILISGGERGRLYHDTAAFLGGWNRRLSQSSGKASFQAHAAL
jgi:hypothetical protein